MKIICTLPNASTLISGVAFSSNQNGDGMISADVSADVAATFLEIPGYEIAPDKKPAKVATPAPVPAIE